MKTIPQTDIDYLVQQPKEQVCMIVSGMTALLQDTEGKVSAMQAQNWFQRMVKTVSGKNKLTVEDIRKNHDKLNAYMAEAISVLYNQNRIDRMAILSLGTRLNEVYTEQIQLKDIIGTLVSKLNDKINSVDNFNMLRAEIDQGKYNSDSWLTSLCMITSQYDNLILADQRKLDILRRSLEKQNIINDDPITISDFLKEAIKIRMPFAGNVYLALGSIHNDYMASLAMKVMENYHFLSDMARKAKNTESIVDRIIVDEDIDAEASTTVTEIYDAFVSGKCDMMNMTVRLPDNDLPFDGTGAGALQQIDAENTLLTSDNEEALIDHAGVAYAVEEDLKEAESEEETEPPEIEEYHVDHMLHIQPDETVPLHYKDVHIHSLINCNGTLFFDHCVIHYNETDNADEIKLGEGSSLIAEGCAFVCHGFDKNPFISGHGIVSFEACSFYDCSCFLSGIETIQISDCLLKNCGVDFVNGAKEFVVKSTTIQLEQLAEFNVSGAQNNSNGVYGSVFHSRSQAEATGFLDVTVEYSDDIYEECLKHFYLFDVEEGVFTNCSFKNAFNCIRGTVGINRCLFIGCKSPVGISSNDNYSGSIKSSCFLECDDCIVTYGKIAITQCRFVDCRNSIISVSMKGIDISSCEFINSENKRKKELFPGCILPTSIITIGGSKDSSTSHIDHCVFDGVFLDHNYLIMTDICENVKQTIVSINDCDFRNCWTNREQGTIIRDIDSYYPKFSRKQKFVKTISISSNCKGLKKVHIGEDGKKTVADVDTSVSVDKETVGAKIGKAVKYVTLAYFGGVVGVAVGAVVDKKRAEQKKLERQYLSE